MKLLFDFFYVSELRSYLYFLGKNEKVYLSTFSKEKLINYLVNAQITISYDRKSPFLFREEVNKYFAGKLRNFKSKPVFEKSFSPLILKIWRECQRIPYGKTLSYGALGKKVDKNKKLARVVGHAMQRNSHLLLIPCHRVIKADGKIGGFSNGENKKRFLLALEKG
jgi:O-6-methylguanine DNA methyltransferase